MTNQSPCIRWGSLRYNCFTYFTCVGSVLPLTTPVAIFSGIVTFALMYWNAFPINVPGGNLMQHPNTFQFLLTIASLLVAFQTTSSYNRYWEGRTALQSMASAWAQAASAVLSCDDPYCKSFSFEHSTHKQTSRSSSESSVKCNIGVANHQRNESTNELSVPSVLKCDAESWLSPGVMACNGGQPHYKRRRRTSCIGVVTWGVAAYTKDPLPNDGEPSMDPPDVTIRVNKDLCAEPSSPLRYSRTSAAPAHHYDGPSSTGKSYDLPMRINDSQSSPSWSTFKAQCVHLLSALHAAAIRYLLGNIDENTSDPKLEILGGLHYIEECNLRFYCDQTFLIFHWLSHFVNTYDYPSDGAVSTALRNRCLSHLAIGLAAYDSACKIEDTPFPLPYIQLMYILDLAVILMTPVIISCWVESISLAVILTFILVLIFHGAFRTARVMENPFGTSSNDLPMIELHEDFVDRLLCLIDQPTADILNDMVKVAGNSYSSVRNDESKEEVRKSAMGALRIFRRRSSSSSNFASNIRHHLGATFRSPSVNPLNKFYTPHKSAQRKSLIPPVPQKASKKNAEEPEVSQEAMAIQAVTDVLGDREPKGEGEPKENGVQKGEGEPKRIAPLNSHQAVPALSGANTDRPKTALAREYHSRLPSANVSVFANVPAPSRRRLYSLRHSDSHKKSVMLQELVETVGTDEYEIAGRVSF